MEAQPDTNSSAVAAPEAPERPSRIIAVYGTLRVGQPLYKAYIEPVPHEVLQRNTILYGFAMWKLPFLQYPIAHPMREMREHWITVDYIKVTESTFRRINEVECAAGYSPKEVAFFGEYATMYIQYPATPIPNGDWVDYVKTHRAEF